MTNPVRTRTTSAAPDGTGPDRAPKAAVSKAVPYTSKLTGKRYKALYTGVSHEIAFSAPLTAAEFGYYSRLRCLVHDRRGPSGEWASFTLHTTFARLGVTFGGGQGPASPATVERTVKRLSDLGLISTPVGGPVRVSRRRPHHSVALVVPMFHAVERADGTYASAEEIADALPAMGVLNPEVNVLNPEDARHPAMDAHIVHEPGLTSGNGPLIPRQIDWGSVLNSEGNVLNLEDARTAKSQVRDGAPRGVSSSLLSSSTSEAGEEDERRSDHALPASAGAPPSGVHEGGTAAVGWHSDPGEDARHLLSELDTSEVQWCPPHVEELDALCASLTASRWTPGDVARCHANRAGARLTGRFAVVGAPGRSLSLAEKILETLRGMDIRDGG